MINAINYTEIIKDQTERPLWSINNVIDSVPNEYWNKNEFNHFGMLRIDLQNKYEKQLYIDEILHISNQDFYKDFGVESIITKAITNATERISSLRNNGYVQIEKKFMIYDDYFVNSIIREN